MKRWKKDAVRVCILLLLVLTGLVGCNVNKAEESSQSEESSTELREMNPEDLDEITMDGLVSDMLENMTLEQKIGQMFIVYTDSLDFNAATEMTDQMKEAIETYQPGGVIFFSFNLESRKQTKKFIRKMQKASTIPMFIAVDEEGGTVARIANTEGMGTTQFPSMSEIGATGDPEEAYNVGTTIGSEISALGFNLDFAPVADITTNEENTEIGERSFGSDAELVSEMVVQVVNGLQEYGVSATLKHFPGQGDSGDDTHKGYVNLDTTIDRLREVEFQPFEAGIEAGVDFIMMSHVSVSAITQTEEPASLSSLMVTDILREELQYDNIIITDAMNMKIITKFYEPGEAAVKAIQAGNDMVLMPDNFVDAYEAVRKAVEDGTISESTINASVSRILETKIRRGIISLDSLMPQPQEDTQE